MKSKNNYTEYEYTNQLCSFKQRERTTTINFFEESNCNKVIAINADEETKSKTKIKIFMIHNQ